ncbi:MULTISPECIES: cellulase family glycosylhydrolase [unclassified Sinorhizobium]|uniref:cellulase family glycosylhydrolase n=1 Tax=unclassified Sinorhizobium TaxID=2613772 RepID=UPI00352698F4
MKSPTLAFAALVAIALTISLSREARAQGFVHADHQQIVDGDGKPLILRGIGLGGWMVQEGYMLTIPDLGSQRVIRSRISKIIGARKTEQFYRAWRDNAVTRADIDAMAGWGFNSVRLPMHWNLFIKDVPGKGGHDKVVWNDEGFRRVDALIGWLKANHMVLILDLHAAPGGQGNDLAISDRDSARPSLWDSADNQAKMIALWTEIARRYKDEPTIAGYDLLNEPNWGFQDKADIHGCRETGNIPMRELYERTIRAIRAVDRNHMLIIEGNCWGNNYAGLLPVADRNTTLSFHKYWTDTTQQAIEPFLKLRAQYDMPLWNGETGENSNDWYARAIELAEKNNIGWSMWPLKKIGISNPLEIVAGDEYRSLASYLRGQGKKPTADVAFAGLMQLARASRFDRNVQHPDVIDALFRASHSNDPIPFKEHRITSTGGVIAAVDYDLGKEGFAYHHIRSDDADLSHGGALSEDKKRAVYRNDPVEIAQSGDDYWLSHIKPGEWLRYSFDSDGAYTFPLILRTRGTGTLSVALNGHAEQTVSVDTRDWSEATTLPQQFLKGRNVLIVKSIAGAPDVSSLKFRQQDEDRDQ